MGYPTPADRFVQQAIPNGCTAKNLGSSQRLILGVQALAGHQSITSLADDFDVSRKFVYQQADRAQAALDEAFAPTTAEDQVLFSIPVTKAWLRQVTLGLILIGHSSYRGVFEFCRDLLDVPLSLGTVHNIVQEAVDQARGQTQQVPLDTIAIAGLDEIFQNNQPVLVGADIASTYCFLLRHEDHRDADTWALRLLELTDRGFAPTATVADFGSGLRAGQRQALPEVPCRGDVLHVLLSITPVRRYLDQRAYDAIAAVDQLHQKKIRTQRQARTTQGIGRPLADARHAADRAIALADDVTVLTRWLQHDVFAVSGLPYADRCVLYDFILAELKARQPQCPHRLGPVCTLLTNHRDDLLAFAAQLDADLLRLAATFEVPERWVRDLFDLQRLDQRRPQRWHHEAALRHHLGPRFLPLTAAVRDVAAKVVRASSIIENINSRLRNYFFLRRHLGNDYLALLQFFLNHRRFLRSECPERVNHSPAELLTGQTHPHWLEMLGYQRFSRN